MAARDTKKLTTKKLASTPTPEAKSPAAPTPPPMPVQLIGEWIPVVYQGSGMYADADAGVFVPGTRTRLQRPIATRLLRIDGFRLAG